MAKKMTYKTKYILRKFAKLSICFIITFILICSTFELIFNNTRFFTANAPSVGYLAEYNISNNPFLEQAKMQIPDYQEKFNSRIEKNAHTKGWLYMPNTGIDDPIMQYKDNDYYLRRNEDKGYSFHGCYFADFRVNMDKDEELSQNTVIYGHNIFDDGKNFSQLMKYLDYSHMAQNPYIYLATEEKIYVYQIFAVYYTFVDFYYIEPNPTPEDFSFVIDEAKRRSQYITDVDVKETDKIITLSTCCYKYKTSWGSSRTDQRFVIQAVMVDENNMPEYKLPIVNPTPKLPTEKLK